MTYFLNLRAVSVGGGLADEVATLSGSATCPAQKIFDAARGKDVLFVTHGFNVNEDDAINSLTIFESLIDSPGIIFIGVLWPGDSRWAPVIDYPVEGDEAIGGGNMLASYINTNFQAATSVSFASHSLGARLVLQTIRNLDRSNVRNLILMAAAIDDDCLVNEYEHAARKVGTILVLASERDDVLAFAFPAGNFLAGIISRGDPYWHAALGHDGPDTPLPSNLVGPWELPDGWAFGHGSYLPSNIPTFVQVNRPVKFPLPDDPPLSDDGSDGWQYQWSSAFVATHQT